MPKPVKDQDEPVEPTEEDQKRFTDTVKRLLNTPHRPHKPVPPAKDEQ